MVKKTPQPLEVTNRTNLPTYQLLGGSSQDLDTWLITMVIVSPLGLFFQMAVEWRQ